MNRPARLTLLVAAALVVVLVAGSLLIQSQRFPYGLVSASCVLASAVAGWLVARDRPAAVAGAAGGFVSLAGPALAWALLNALPPGRALAPRAQMLAVAEAIAVLVLAGALAGLAGAWVARAGRR